MYPARDLTVKVIDGHHVYDKGKCHKISIQIEGLELQSGLYALPLNGMDMVLGAEWLAQLGTYTANLEKRFMEFYLHDKHYKLYGKIFIPKEGEVQPWQKKKHEKA